MKVLPVQQSFSAGEVTPLLYMREGIPALENGLKHMQNMVAVSHGPAVSRPGTQLVATVGSDVTAARGFEFPVSDSEAYWFACVEDDDVASIQVHDLTGPLLDPSMVPQVMLNHDFAAAALHWDAVGIKATQHIAWGYGLCVMSVPYPHGLSVGLRQTVVAPSTEQYRLTVVTSDTIMPLRIIVGLDDGINGIPTQIHFEAPIAAGATSTSVVVDLVQGVNYRFVVYAPAEVVYENAQFRTVYIISLKKNTGDPVVLSIAGMPPGWANSVRAVPVPGQTEVWLVSSMGAPRKLAYNRSTGAWTTATLGFTSTPGSWGAMNWPTCLAFHQGRSWWAGVPSHPEYLWASKSGSPLDLTLGPLADDALSYQISHKGEIRWLKAASSLVVGTTVSEYVIAAEGGIIIPGDIEAKAQSRMGSHVVDAVDLGNKIMFLHRSGDRVFDMGYKWEEEKWIPRNIAYVSEHLFNDIAPIGLAEVPDGSMLVLLSTGTPTVLSCTYDEYNNIIGWHTHRFPWNIVWCVVVTSAGVSRIFFLAIDDGKLLILRYETAIFLDGSVSRTLSPASTTVPDLFHLVGRYVTALVEETVYPNLLVSEQGEITLPEPATEVIVGVPLVRSMTTLPYGYASVIGSGRAMQKRWSKLFLRLVHSAMPKINGVRPRVRRSDFEGFEAPIIMDEGFVEVSQSGWSKDGSITIEQDLPYPLTVTGIYGELIQEKE